ncbi:MAG: hypothetical protein IKL05_05305 [Clostridia bacterium]|nr:hypothetical protein [Clostridia bacterium]
MKKALFPISESASTITLKNNYIQITLSKENGNVVELVNLMNGESILAQSDDLAFSSITLSETETVYPSSLALENEKLKFVFKNVCDVYVAVDAYDDYIAFTLDSDIPETVRSVSFGSLKADYYWELDNENAFGLSGIAMTTTVDPTYFPGGSLKATKGTAYTIIGVPLKGSKLGIAFSRMTEHRDHLKSIVDDIDPAKGITSKHGGPYALDHKDIFGDYVLLQRGLNLKTIDETIRLCKKYSVEQIDMHHGGFTFLHGDFDFRSAATDEELEAGTFTTAKTFKERIADKITPHGIQLGLHTYSSLVPNYAKTIVTVPKWQQQLCYDPNTYTVKGELSAEATDILTYEDASNISITSSDMPYNRNHHTRYLLIDEEIVLIQGGNASGFPEVVRGALETKASAHKDGAEIRQLTGWYSMFQSKPLSELFYHLADITAKAYNEGGFEMIYLDGLESFRNADLSEKDARYYIYAEFVRAVVSQCKNPPLIEYSSFFPYIWNARGRGGATDYSRRGYKQFKNNHLDTIEKYHGYFYTSTVGWFCYAPDRLEQHKNAFVQTMFRDDLDHMGSLAVANNFGTVCQPFSVTEINDGSNLLDNFEYYGLYTRLREGNYFAPEVKKEILARKHEHKIFKQADGSWAFKEMEYFKHRALETEVGLATGKAENPFNAQTPYVRIEQGYSSLGEDAVVMKEFDETKPITEYVGTHEITEKEQKENRAFKFRVHGNGTDDKIIVALGSYSGKYEMEVSLNFTGWKDIILVEPILISEYSTNSTFRMSTVWSISFDLVGECKDVRIGNFYSVNLTEDTVTNPGVTINGKTMTFETQLNSGEYVEYYPEFNKAYRTYYTPTPSEDGVVKAAKAHTEEIKFNGCVEVPTGSFTYTYNADSTTSAPTRAAVVIGVSGKVIKNPDNWKAPDLDIPEGIEQIKIK